jgi:uncharacterized protein (DUF1778 family)
MKIERNTDKKYKMLREGPVIRLSQEEWNRLIQALERPGRKPNAATQKAIKIYMLGRDIGDQRIW